MEVGKIGRGLMLPMMIANFVVYIIVVGLAAWSLDKYIDGQQDHPHLGGNPSTTYMLEFGLLGGATGLCSLVIGFMHLRAWRSASLASASSSAFISWAITAVAFGFAWKEIKMGGRRGKRLQTLELFITISAISLCMLGYLARSMDLIISPIGMTLSSTVCLPSPNPTHPL